MKKIQITSILLILFALLLSGCGNSAVDSKQTAAADEGSPKFVNGKLTQTFKLKLPTPTGFNEIIVADKKGFLKEVGLEVEYTGTLPQNATLAQSVIQGYNHVFGSGHATTIASARQAGANLKIVQAGTLDSPEFDKTHMTWFVKSGSGITKAEDLRGKTIAMSGKGSCAELFNSEFLRQNGINPNETKIIVMNDLQQEQALRRSDIDVAILHAPHNMKAKNNGGLDILATSYKIAAGAGDGRFSAVGVRAFSEDFIKKYPDVVKAYIVATVKTQHYINDHYEDAMKIAAEFLKVDVQDMAGTTYGTYKWVQPEQIKFWVDLAEKNKLSGFETPGKVIAEDLYTNEYNPYYTGELK
ncbi:MAG: ABC-type nitrate/sulfonate/bicarbonate transport system, periplasmic component [Sporomusa sp.]|jgi:ABC-type nitrate/sulfonate/bicarbonate transport system substrate-binding protein|nr:ABC-type nitrate/sulfonate/bicarbonate transport system, periplasmic component [Sporomusa sp.]